MGRRAVGGLDGAVRVAGVRARGGSGREELPWGG